MTDINIPREAWIRASNMEEVITVPKAKWEELLKRLSWLHALEDAGVDNWEGISYAHELFNEEYKDDEE